MFIHFLNLPLIPEDTVKTSPWRKKLAGDGGGGNGGWRGGGRQVSVVELRDKVAGAFVVFLAEWVFKCMMWIKRRPFGLYPFHELLFNDQRS